MYIICIVQMQTYCGMLPAWVTYHLKLHQPHVSNKNTSIPLYCLRMENYHTALLWDPLFWSNFDFSPLFLFDLQEFQVAIVTSILPLRTPKRLRHDGDTLRMDGTQVGILERWVRMTKSPKKWRKREITLQKINNSPQSHGGGWEIQFSRFKWVIFKFHALNFPGCIRQCSSCFRMPGSHPVNF